MYFQNDTRYDIDDEALFREVTTLIESDNNGSVEMRKVRDIGIPCHSEIRNTLDCCVQVIRGSFARDFIAAGGTTIRI